MKILYAQFFIYHVFFGHLSVEILQNIQGFMLLLTNFEIFRRWVSFISDVDKNLTLSRIKERQMTGI